MYFTFILNNPGRNPGIGVVIVIVLPSHGNLDSVPSAQQQQEQKELKRQVFKCT